MLKIFIFFFGVLNVLQGVSIKSMMSYHRFLEKYEYSLILFTSDECKFSNKFQKSINLSSKKVKDFYNKTKDPFFLSIGFAKIKLNNLPSLAYLLNLSQTPTFLLFRGIYPYKFLTINYHDKSDLVEWTIKEILKDIKKIQTKQEIELFFLNFRESVVIIMDSNDYRQGLILNYFLKVKDIYPNVQYRRVEPYIVFEEPFFWEDKCHYSIKILFYFGKNEEFEVIELKDGSFISYEDLVFLFDKYFLPANGIHPFDEVLVRKFLKMRYPILLYILSEDDNSSQKLEILQTFCQKNNEIRGFFIKDNKFDLRKWINFLGKKGYLFLITQENEDSNILKFPFPIKQIISIENLEFFYKDYLNQKIEPYLRNNPQLSLNNNFQENLLFYDAKDFHQKIILKNNRNQDFLLVFCSEKDDKFTVILEFFQKIANKLFHLQDFTIIFFDPEKNDFIGKEIRFFPTIRLYTTKNEIIEYPSNILEENSLDVFLQNSLTILNKTNIRKKSE